MPGQGLATTPGQTFLGHRKGWPAQAGDWQDTGGTCAASARGLHSRIRGHICGVHAVKIPKILPGRGGSRLTANLYPDRGREQPASAPSHSLQVDCQPISSHIKHETWAKNEDTFFRSKGARWCPSYFIVSSSKRNSCSFSPMSLFAPAGFTYADPWLNFKELYYWSQQ